MLLAPAVVVVLAKVIVGNAVLDNEVDDGQYLVADGDHGAVVATPGGQASIAGRQVAALGAGGRTSDFAEGSP